MTIDAAARYDAPDGRAARYKHQVKKMATATQDGCGNLIHRTGPM